jgi:outer membrane protein TolC
LLPPGTLPIQNYRLNLSFKTDPIQVQQFSTGVLQPGAPAALGFDGVRVLSLEMAQIQAAAVNDPLVRLGELQVEAAKQHRLGAQGDYFPQIGTTLYNMHFNKQPGQVLTSPITGRFVSVNIITKNETAFNVSATQPITPLFAIYQLVKIARADENIARAKAGLPIKEIANMVERNYFDLLVAQRELTSARAGAEKIHAKWLRASNSATPGISAEEETEVAAADKAVLLASSREKELTASLNGLLGLPEGTTLELLPPEPLVEDISLKAATENATSANPEVVEAEQTAIKAHAGKTLSKMAYVPVVAVIGGYANQNAINVVLPRDFGYIGFVATLNIFDGFKREHGVKERNAQAEAADLAVQLTKAKVAAAVKSSYLELDRLRNLYLLARRMVSGTPFMDASYKSGDRDAQAAKAQMEADMFRAELEYRQTYAKVKSLMGNN